MFLILNSNLNLKYNCESLSLTDSLVMFQFKFHRWKFEFLAEFLVISEKKKQLDIKNQNKSFVKSSTGQTQNEMRNMK